MRLWLAAWTLCASALIAAVTVAQQFPCIVSARLLLTATLGAVLALLGCVTLRQRLLVFADRNSRHESHACRISLRRRTRRLAATWALEGFAAVAGALLATCTALLGLSVITGAAVLLLITPPKLLSDADAS